MNDKVSKWFYQHFGDRPWSHRLIEPQDFEVMPKEVLVELLETARMVTPRNGLDQADFLEAVLLRRCDLFVIKGYKAIQIVVVWNDRP